MLLGNERQAVYTAIKHEIDLNIDGDNGRVQADYKTMLARGYLA